MKLSPVLGALLATAVIAPAFAQTAPAPAKAPVGSYLREVDDNEPLKGPGGLTVRQMEAMPVFTANGQNLGDVEEVIANNRGKIVGITAEVGGFLGVGDKEVLIPLEHLKVENDRFRTTLTEEQLKALPEWDDD